MNQCSHKVANVTRTALTASITTLQLLLWVGVTFFLQRTSKGCDPTGYDNFSYLSVFYDSAVDGGH